MQSLHLYFFFVGGTAAAIGILSLIFARRAPGQLWFLTGMLLLALEAAVVGQMCRAPGASEVVFWAGWQYLILALIPSVWLLFALSFSRGNDQARLLRWLPVLALGLVIPVAALFFFPEGLALQSVDSTNRWELTIGGTAFLVQAAFLILSALVLINLERTFRAAVGTMRWRIKYFVLGAAAIFAGRLYTSTEIVLFHVENSNLHLINASALLIGCLFFVAGFTRPGSFLVQVYPSERVIQFSVAGLLIGAYLVAVGLLSKIVTIWTGEHAFVARSFSVLLALAILAVLLLSERVRERIGRFASRHFDRPQFNYRSVWLNFIEQSASILEPEPLCRLAANWASEELRVLSVSVWLVEEDGKHLRAVASTCLTEVSGQPDFTPARQVPDLIEALARRPDPFEIEKEIEPWADTLKSFYPDYFKHAGNRVCVPLQAGGRLLGLITLGDRVNGVPMGFQEFDLLKCVADQVASNLLNMQLSQRLLRAKEMEAFQTISAFFIHDLKNTASTLSLTLQNLPKHWDKPEFRKDALKAISKSVEHIDDLIKRLTLFRQRLEIRPSSVDLNNLIHSSLGVLGTDRKIIQDFELRTNVHADADQLRKVIANLLLNAREATSPDAEIKIQTTQRNGWAVFSVTDTGCGMSPEFLARNLFRPFQTTKKGGIGIGMFQSKAIVEAHGGRIEVDSQPGRGTTFQVLLPAR